LRSRREDVVAVSPIVGGAAIKGPADRMLRELGHEPTALGVAHLYAPWVGTFVVDDVDAALAPAIERLGLRCVVTDTVMANRRRAGALAAVVRDAGH
jgi:LPPG:FO 2-phospho-L-lactate transferase